nr:eukaryotic translation initiation factor 3 subunit K isoform X1 [Oryctolagus cuniculus]
MAMFEQMRANVGKLLKGIDRYNPENLATLERYVETQAKENAYDLEANLAVLKLYQFNPAFFQTTVTAQILLKALTNLPHTDFTLCKCMIDQAHQEERPIRQILYLGDLLETCHFQAFWQALDENMDLLEGITGFEDSVRKFICHVVGITYQHIDRWLLAEMLGDLTDSQLKMWMSKYGWSADESGQIFICSQEESIKPKNIVEKIDFDNRALLSVGHSPNAPNIWAWARLKPEAENTGGRVQEFVASQDARWQEGNWELGRQQGLEPRPCTTMYEAPALTSGLSEAPRRHHKMPAWQKYECEMSESICNSDKPVTQLSIMHCVMHTH